MLERLNELVREILENEIEARDDDDVLCALVDARINPSILEKDYMTVRKNRAEYGLPPIESVTRSRRYIQKTYPALKGSDWITRRRVRREKMYREYFRENK